MDHPRQVGVVDEEGRRALRYLDRIRLIGRFVWTRKLWWMLPVLVILLALSLLIVFAEGSALAPFIYTLF